MPFGHTWKNYLYKCAIVWILLTFIWFCIRYFETRRTKVAYVKWEHRNVANMPILVRGVGCNSLWWGTFGELLWLKRCCLIHRSCRTNASTASDCIFPLYFPASPTTAPAFCTCLSWIVCRGKLAANRSVLPAGL